MNFMTQLKSYAKYDVCVCFSEDLDLSSDSHSFVYFNTHLLPKRLRTLALEIFLPNIMSYMPRVFLS